MESSISLRHNLRASDVGAIARLHGELYGREFGWDRTFEDYVRGPLREFSWPTSARQKIWLLERRDSLVGCIAIAHVSDEVAQLRWYLVDPSIRGQGWGKRLLTEAVEFCREQGYKSVVLYTVDVLTDAARLYAAAGFQLLEEKPAAIWGAELLEQQYELQLQ